MHFRRDCVLTIVALFGTHLSGVHAFAQAPRDPTQPHPLVEPSLAKIDAGIAEGPFRAEWSSLEGYEIPQWYKDAKFGIFIHWGAYSVPAFGSEWYPRQMYIKQERRGDDFFQHHLAVYGPQKTHGYKDFIPQFKAERFDAEAWAKLFKETGARYVIPVAEHHDGFPMYDCSFTRWDATQMGPKRDVIAELSKAVRNEGMKFGVSSHRAFNWMFYVRDESYDNADPQYADLYGRPMPFLYAEDAWDYKKHFTPQDQQFKDDWLARSCELVDKYQPDVFWFDFGITPKQDASYEDNSYAEYLKRFAAYYYNRSSAWPDGVGIINYKFNAFPEGAAVLDKERSKMAAIRKPFWQTDTAVSESSWGYTKNQRYKTPDRLVDDLVDIVSKNGCLLLNVGPRADGVIPEEDQAILRAIGGWLKINGEAIYDTTYWKTYGEGPTSVSTGHVSEAQDKPFTAEDLRFTTRDGVLYVTGLAWPEDNRVTVRSLASGGEYFPEEIASITMLGSDEVLKWTRNAKGLTVQLPKERPSEFAYVLKVAK
ncbi:Alpha-L-fucosidase [Pirellulimonas nuda]|uniref:alpha-L-fucosidase n=1 Tax=Pirellulimonas nuda TaxID=2528009 RepID=A0A518DE36_9BACT|nr:alpha-L-fucosidase [Pirellulimonas nuda]QDU89748.1 Alpha-L-fucosidase [Pirellulimonas nuda]